MREDAVQIVCLDLEGVLVPEIWIEVSRRTSIPELARTTRDEPDYAKLMRGRLALLQRHALRLPDLQAVIAQMRPLEGAKSFLDALRLRTQVVILSDTFYEFAAPLMRQLSLPTLFCHELVADESGRVLDYRLRLPDQKRAAVAAFRTLNFHTIAVGDSYNDTTMLAAAHAGILYRPPANVADEFPHYRVAGTYDELSRAIDEVSRDAIPVT